VRAPWFETEMSRAFCEATGGDVVWLAEHCERDDAVARIAGVECRSGVPRLQERPTCGKPAWRIRGLGLSTSAPCSNFRTES
jgi:hypothetical protein